MKTSIIQKPTRNVDGLLIALREKGSVISVASDSRNTYVYTEDGNDTDFTPLVEAWKDDAELWVETDAPKGPDGVPVVEANASDKHTITVRKATVTGELVPDNDKIIVETPQPVKLTEAKFRLASGVGVFTVGPSLKIGDVFLRVRDASARLREVRLHVRFGEVRPLPPPAPAPEEPLPVVHEERSDLWSKIRRALRF